MPAKITLFKARPLPPKAVGYLEFIPCPLAYWRTDESACVINALAVQLTGYSADELQENASLWIERIHPDDREAYRRLRRILWNGESPGSSEYRFFPKGSSREKWIGESSVLLRNADAANGVISVYRDVSELVELRRQVRRQCGMPQIGDVIPGLVHEMENHLQLIKGSLDLLQRDYMKSTAVSLAETGVRRTNTLLRELEQFVLAGQGEISSCNTLTVLKELCHFVEHEFRAHNISVNFQCTEPLPDVWVNPDEFRRALYTVLNFARALLPQGGEVRIEARHREAEIDYCLELVVSSRGKTSTSLKEEDVFRPFLKINGHSIGLSMLLAQQMLARQDGKICFEREATSAPTFRIVLQAKRR